MDVEKPVLFPCACGRLWPSPGYAADCADQDAMEADDREHVRFYRSNN